MSTREQLAEVIRDGEGTWRTLLEAADAIIAAGLLREARAEGWDEAIEFMGQASSSAFYAQMLRFEAHKRYGAARAAAIRAGGKP